jgi:prevent-host-death family protein
MSPPRRRRFVGDRVEHVGSDAYRGVMTEVGLREMRRNAGDLVRRAEAGEKVTITVAGRPAAILGPVTSRAWRSWGEVSDVFREPADAEWEADRARLDDTSSSRRRPMPTTPLSTPATQTT